MKKRIIKSIIFIIRKIISLGESTLPLFGRFIPLGLLENFQNYSHEQVLWNFRLSKTLKVWYLYPVVGGWYDNASAAASIIFKVVPVQKLGS